MLEQSGENLQAILQRAANGDEAAWREIVELYSPRVFGLVRAQCGNADLAEEITQSTFCTIVAKLPAYTEQGRFEPWLFRIATNRLRDEMRRRKRHAVAVEDDTLAGLAGTGEADKSARVSPGDLDRLRSAMDRLTHEDQRIIHLRHFGGLSFKQIADVLDQPLGTVLARQHRALKKLRELIRTQGGAE